MKKEDVWERVANCGHICSSCWRCRSQEILPQGSVTSSAPSPPQPIMARSACAPLGAHEQRPDRHADEDAGRNVREGMASLARARHFCALHTRAARPAAGLVTRCGILNIQRSPRERVTCAERPRGCPRATIRRVESGPHRSSTP
jgi:hypothetical protein